MLSARARHAARVVVTTHVAGPLHYTRPSHQREASLRRCTAMLRCVSCGLPRQASEACRVAQAPLRCLSLGRRHSTHAFRARTPRRAGCGRTTHVAGPVHYTRSLHQREASLLRCTAVLQHASFGLQYQASAASRVAQPPLRSLPLGRKRGTRACGSRAPRHAVCWSVHALCKTTASARGLSPSVHGRAPTCRLRNLTSSRLALVRIRDRVTAIVFCWGEA